MLPSRSKRYVDSDGQIARLHLITPLELALISVALVALLVLVFPRQTLFEQLYRLSSNDELTINYLENLLRADRDNLALRLMLARARSAHLGMAELDELLAPVELNGSAQQRREATFIRFRVLMASLGNNPSAADREQILRTLQELLQHDWSADELIYLADAAIEMQQRDTALTLYRRARQLAPNRYGNWIPYSAKRSLGFGYYRMSADLYFIARHEARDRASARSDFIAGVGALMADSRYREAMADADRHVGDLITDTETLRYLTRAAQSAGNLRAAARYARILMGLNENAPEEPRL